MKKDKRDQFYVGVNPLVIRKGKLLLGRRKNVVGHNTWGFPGGHLEVGESIEKCAERELYEETGMRCKIFILNNVINQIISKHKYYLQIGVEAIDVRGEPKVMEPDKCYELKWFDFNKLPKNILKWHKEQIKVFLKNKK